MRYERARVGVGHKITQLTIHCTTLHVATMPWSYQLLAPNVSWSMRRHPGPGTWYVSFSVSRMSLTRPHASLDMSTSASSSHGTKRDVRCTPKAVPLPSQYEMLWWLRKSERGGEWEVCVGGRRRMREVTEAMKWVKM